MTTIFVSTQYHIPLANIAYLEDGKIGLWVVLNGSTWNTECDAWNNAPYICDQDDKARLIEMFNAFHEPEIVSGNLNIPL